MNVVKKAIKCDKCSAILDRPITLPCGVNVCQKHLVNLVNGKFSCGTCQVDHDIEDKMLNVNKSLELLLNANIKSLNLGTKYNEAYRACTQLDKICLDMDRLLLDPNFFIVETVAKLKNRVDLLREKFKLSIDQKADQITQQLDNYVLECKNNLKSNNELKKHKMHRFTENNNLTKRSLTEWKETLNYFGSAESDWTSIKQKSDQAVVKQNNELISMKRELLQNKLKPHFDLVSNFQHFKLPSFDKTMWDFCDLNQIMTNELGLIDERADKKLAKIRELIPSNNIRLLYRASEHGLSTEAFFEKCNGLSNTLTLIETTRGNFFTRNTKATWDRKNPKEEHKFLLSLVEKPYKQLLVTLRESTVSKLLLCGDKCKTVCIGHEILLSSMALSSNEITTCQGFKNLIQRELSFRDLPQFDCVDIDVFEIS